MKRLLLFTVLLAACGSGATGPAAVMPPVAVHDPEILFHFFYHRDSVGAPLHTEPYPDTAIMRWYQGSLADSPRRLLAQVAITGTDSICAYFFAPTIDTMYWELAWRRQGTTTAAGILVGPLRPDVPSEYNQFWDVATSADTVNVSYSADIMSRAAPSYCPPGMRRDSITP
jgi:hypothetical protein